MNFWNRIEQTFKRRYLKVLERHFAKEVVMPQLINFGKIQNILVIRQHDQLGDFLLCTPVLRALRENFPSARIGLLVREYVADVARNHPYVDDLLIFHEDLRKWTPKEIAKFYRQLRDGWELAIVLNTVSHSLTSDLLAYFSGAKYILGSEHRVFPGCSRNFFYNLIAPYWEGERHQTERNLDIVRHIGVETHELQEVMQLSEKEKEMALETLRNAGYRTETLSIGMHVGAGKIRNRWPLEHFAALAQYLNDYFQVQILLFWGPKEQELADKFLQHVEFEPICMPPGNLRDLAALFTCCDILICNDTGVMHLAAANQVPLVAIFGPTDPDEWKPVGESFIGLRGEDGNTANVRVEQVFEALKTLLGEKLLKQLKTSEGEVISHPDFDNFDISETVIENYVASLQKLEHVLNRDIKKK